MEIAGTNLSLLACAVCLVTGFVIAAAARRALRGSARGRVRRRRPKYAPPPQAKQGMPHNVESWSQFAVARTHDLAHRGDAEHAQAGYAEARRG